MAMILSDPAALMAPSIDQRPQTTDAAGEPASARPKPSWKGAVKRLAETGALGATKRWTAVIDEIKATTAELDSYDQGLRKHTYAATIGKAKREVAKPAPCPVHSYNTSLSTLRSTVATFGKAPLVRPPSTAGPSIHSYSSLGSSFTPKMGATFGRAKTGRGETPKTMGPVHSYSSLSSSFTPQRGATFGTAPARPASVMTKNGMVIASGKSAVLPPLTPLQNKSRTVATSHALGFASKLKRAVASADDVTDAEAAKAVKQSRSASPDILVVEHTPLSSADDAGRGRASGDVTPTAASGHASGDVTPMGASTQGDVTPMEALDEEDAVRGAAAAIALELLHAKETSSPVKRRLTMGVEQGAALSLGA